MTEDRPERRHAPREKVFYRGVASTGPHGVTRDCIVRNLSDEGAKLEFGSAVGLPREIGLAIPRRERSLLARIIWWRDNHVGVAFESQQKTQDNDRLHKTERLNRALRRKVKLLLGEG